MSWHKKGARAEAELGIFYAGVCHENVSVAVKISADESQVSYI